MLAEILDLLQQIGGLLARKPWRDHVALCRCAVAPGAIADGQAILSRQNRSDRGSNRQERYLESEFSSDTLHDFMLSNTPFDRRGQFETVALIAECSCRRRRLQSVNASDCAPLAP